MQIEFQVIFCVAGAKIVWPLTVVNVFRAFCYQTLSLARHKTRRPPCSDSSSSKSFITNRCSLWILVLYMTEVAVYAFIPVGENNVVPWCNLYILFPIRICLNGLAATTQKTLVAAWLQKIEVPRTPAWRPFWKILAFREWHFNIDPMSYSRKQSRPCLSWKAVQLLMKEKQSSCQQATYSANLR